MGREGENYAMVCKFGFIGLVAFSFVGADVLDGPFSFRKDLLSGKGSLRGVEDVAPYDWFI